MKHALHAILGVGLSLAGFSGLLLYRQLFDVSNAIFAPRVDGTPVLNYSVAGYSFFVGLFVAATAVAGLIAGRRWIAPEPRTYSPRFHRLQTVALTIHDRRRDQETRRWSTHSRW